MSEFQDLNREYQDLTGQDLFLYATERSPGHTMYVFTDRNLFNRGNALEFLRLKVEAAREASQRAATANGGSTDAEFCQPSGGHDVADNLAT
jgi:hypothetical protein